VKNPIEYLTNTEYNHALRIIGRSPNPLSKYKIKKEIEKSETNETPKQYVYHMLDRLSPPKELLSGYNDDLVICKWNAIRGDSNERLRLVRFINDYFKMGWKIETNDLDANEAPYKISIDDSNGIITIKHGSAIRVKIQRRGDNGFFGIVDVDLYIYKPADSRLPIEAMERGIMLKRNEETLLPELFDEEHKLYIRKDNNNLCLNKFCLHDTSEQPLDFFSNIHNSNSISYLNINHTDKVSKSLKLLNEKQDKLMDEMKKMNRPTGGLVASKLISHYDEMLGDLKNTFLKKEEIQSDRRQWRYSINIRGLIVYILGEIKSEDKRIHNKRISKVLENLHNNYPADFPFLKYYREFKEQYEIERGRQTPAKLPKFFDEVNLLKNIALELQSQIYTADINFLNYWVTKRYVEGVVSYFKTAVDNKALQIEGLPTSLWEKLREYQIANFDVISKYLRYEHNNVESARKRLTSLAARGWKVYF
jgi:hypothetical protein